MFNLVGALAVAVFFGYFSNTLQGDFVGRTIAVAQGRVADGRYRHFYQELHVTSCLQGSI